MNNSFNPDIYPDLIVRLLSGEASEQEKLLVREWVQKDKENEIYFDDITKIWETGEDLKPFSLINTSEDWKKVSRRINRNKGNEKVLPVYKKRSWIKQLSGIAAVFVLLGLAFFWANSTIWNAGNSREISFASVDEVKEIRLPDGTLVTLNKNSELLYPESFGGEKRKVKLRGEAFFEVAHNKEEPFTIATGEVVTQVLGTSFNVNASTAVTVFVTVLSGQVALQEEGNPQEKIILKPGEKGSYLQGNLHKSGNEDINFMSWKTGILTFRHTPLAEVIQELEQYYTQKIRLENSRMENCELTSTFSKKSLEEVLEELKLVLSVEIIKNGNHIIISGEGC